MQREIFEIVDALIVRRFAADVLRLSVWRFIWRNNVRLRLLLTLRARLRFGHKDAANAAWQQFATGTGRTMPSFLTAWGAALIRRRCERRTPAFEDARQSVSPL